MPKGMYISVSDGRRYRHMRSIMRVKYYALQYGKEYRLPFFSALILILVGLLAVYPMPFHAGYVSAGPGTTKQSDTQITLTSTTNKTSVVLNPNLGFILSTAADTATYNVLSNNFSGYTLKIKADDDAGTLVNTEDSTKVIDSITTPIEQSSFIPTTTSLINHWGIKPNKYYDTTNNIAITNTTKILPGPTTTGTILDKTTTANSTANSYDIALGAMVDGTLPAGTYIRNATLEAVANDIYYAISYDKNTAATVDNMPAAQTDTAFVDHITLANNTPTRDHYAFTGWCLGSTATTDNIDSCNGTTFQPGDDFGIDQTTANITTLYAMWKINTYSCTAEYRLQNADGTYPSTYTTAGVVNPSVTYGDTCSYTSTENPTLYTNQTVSDTVTGDITLQLDIPRTTFTLTTDYEKPWVSATTGDGTYRWGEEVAISATLKNATFTTWSQTDGDTSTFADATSASTTFTMPASDATVNATAEAAGPLIQNLSSSTCTTAGPTTVYDSRDAEAYTVKRLADGNCWLLDNLRLDISDSDVKSRLSASTTNATDVVLGYLKDGGGSAPYAANGVVARTPDGGTWVDSYTNPYIATNYKDTVSSVKWGTASGKDGVYYNYCAASAGSYCYGTGAGSGGATYDICPAGWRMPTMDTANNGSYNYLYSTAYSANTTNLKTALSVALSGVIVDNTFALQNEYGRYWSSTFKDANNMHDLRNDASTTSIAYAMRDRGFSVRCVLDEAIAMQNFTGADASSMSINGAKTLKDLRDGQRYTVTKLPNGTVWMTQNLRFTGSDLTPADSNVNTSITLDWSSLKTTPYNSYNDAKYYDSGNTTTGIWYNYAGATAGTIVGSSSTASATQDICPKGWRLPTSAEFTGILSYAAQFNPANTGSFYSGNMNNAGIGYLWSSTAYDATQRYDSRYTGSAFTVNYATRDYGLFVRCVYDQTMQEFDISDAAGMTTNQSKTLKDERDDQLYTVAKLGDNNIWMTKNLAIGCDGDGLNYGSNIINTTFTSDKSNVDSNNFSVSSANSFSMGTNYNDARMACNSTYGAWYNYAAASAGTVTGSSNTTEAQASICPKGWRLPTYAETLRITGYKANYLPVVGGYYNDSGALVSTGYGYQWASTAYDATKRDLIRYDGTNLGHATYYNTERNLGIYVRCVFDKPNTMQNFSLAQAGTMTAGETRYLTDSRDDRDYKVTKLSDGNVWMTQNLALGYNASNPNTATIKLDPADSNVNTAKTITTYDLAAYGASSSSYCYGYSEQGSAFNYACVHSSANQDYGVYYNFNAASAGTIRTNNNTVESKESICPAGWRLPTKAEITAIAGDTNFNPIVGGYYNRGSLLDTNTMGYWWTSTASSVNGTFARTSLIYRNTDSSYEIHEGGARYGGWYVRCIKAADITKATYMQDITESMISGTKVGTVVSLKDSRDNETYKVAKLADGKLWMQDNLNLDLSNATVLNNVNETNTNATATAIGYLKNGGGTASNQWAIQGVANWGYTPLSYSQPLVNTSGHCSTSIVYPCSYNGNYTKETVEPNSVGIGVGSHKIGVYYNYCAATAGSYCYGNGNTSAGSPSGAATQDVCPAGWRLPTGGANGEFQSLCTAVKGSTCNTSETMTPTDSSSMQYKLSATYSGNFGGSYFDATTRQGTFGFFWASTYNVAERMNGLWVRQSDNTIAPQSDLARWGANSIRCISK